MPMAKAEKRWKEITILRPLSIRDTTLHLTDIVEIGDWDVYTIYVSNALDQDVEVQVKANRLTGTIGAVDVGPSFPVSAGSSEAKTWSMQDVFLPFCYCEVKALATPTSGYVAIYLLLKRKNG